MECTSNYMQDISEDILMKASQGDLSAFEEVYKCSAGFVYSVSFRLLSNKEDAEEVTQEVFMNIYRGLKNFRFDSSFKTWVYRISVNTAINYSKKTSKHRHQSMDREDVPEGVSTEDIRQKIDDVVQGEEVSRYLNVLPQDQKTCLVLRCQEGLSYQEIADILRIPINTVRSRIKRARETMILQRKEGIKNGL
jgi:RNA polymerase sigma-70 factor, ECF subfamily